MKTYTHYRVVLLIGLFTLNILSSCVHTGQKLYGEDPLSVYVINAKKTSEKSSFPRHNN
ncbi:MAG: hypothetical protein NMK33_02240 [Candidatus Cardinium sp.]|nr:MAG: hypothetical protein NMK33_02240 [Candidatus Cardinium sp.]